MKRLCVAIALAGALPIAAAMAAPTSFFDDLSGSWSGSGQAYLKEMGEVSANRENKGRTPLVSFAANKGSDIEIAKLLLAAGADPGLESAKDDNSYAALNYTAGTGNLKLAEVLIAAQVDVNHRTSDGSTALHVAAGTNHPEIVRTSGADVNLANTFGNTPIYYASNNPAMRQLLVAAGAK